MLRIVCSFIPQVDGPNFFYVPQPPNIHDILEYWKKDNLGMFLHENMDLWSFTLFEKILTFPRKVKFKNECHHQILHPKWAILDVSHGPHAKSSFGDLIWPDLDLDLYLLYFLFICFLLFTPREAFWQNLGLQLLVVDKAKSGNFYLWLDLDLICEL